MTYRGTVRNGVVVMPADVALPEGAEVVLTVPEPATELAPGASGLGARLAALARWAESQPSDFPEDLAENHGRDHMRSWSRGGSNATEL